MAQTIREITVERDIDPRDPTPISFGGAGGQHAAEVAEEIGIRCVLFPSCASVLSAFDLITADVTYPISRGCRAPRAARLRLDRECLPRIGGAGSRGASRRLRGKDGSFIVRWAADIRYQMQLHELRVPLDRESSSIGRMREAFAAAHRSRYKIMLDDSIELVGLHLMATRVLPEPTPGLDGWSAASGASEEARQTLLKPHPAAMLHRGSPTQTSRIAAPAIVGDVDSTIFIPSGWEIVVYEHGHIVIGRVP